MTTYLCQLPSLKPEGNKISLERQNSIEPTQEQTIRLTTYISIIKNEYK